ncbi:Smr/MutS family protein [Aliiroseovarius sp. YM-037]|uniref:Smr/MutS family protein n=1 Tax=Aliiroseovarius sp. YM-037 TaxID=3341728 RepID=UPI003A80FE16
MTRKRRHLRPDEEELWARVAKTAKPIRPPEFRTSNLTEPKQNGAADDSPRPIEPFSIRSGAKPATRMDLIPSISDQLSRQPVQMDGKAFGKLRRGKMTPDAKIDLHGMTLARAHPALTSFVLNAHASGKRLVLVITGKGRQRDDHGPIPERRGVLKHQVPQWLQSGPLRSVVLQVAQAHVRHGGSGAYYVYLRRNR